MRIKICGLFRDEDIEYVNEAQPDFAGFVFAPSKRQVSPAHAAALRGRLSDNIIPVGVFVNSAIAEIAALYNENVIAIAQLHGDEDEAYIAQLKEASAIGGREPIILIKAIKSKEIGYLPPCPPWLNLINYFLFDSGAGSGKTFNWDTLNAQSFSKPWFLAGGITAGNIAQAMALHPFAVDVSSGAETDGVKNREKILQLTEMVRGKQT